MATLEMQNINEIDDLIKIIAKLPGLGPKSAKRIVLKLINNRDELVNQWQIYWPRFIKM